MSYTVTLLTFGILLLLVGLVGEVKAKELEIGTNSKIVRIILSLIGIVLVVLSVLMDPDMRAFFSGQNNQKAAAKIPAGSFKKQGNNGTVSCNTYCGATNEKGKPVWGKRIGYCVEAQYTSDGTTVSCETIPGLMTDDMLTCFCAPGVKIRHGNNGAISCNAFCERTKETCVAAWDNVTNTNGDATCDHLPGFLNGQELTCTCR
ncbi:MAG: hypothetical protein D3924_20325 [Candidatus Electrothrix sp. AR4]|nr:hypothetical protein [Candidatus Electrothrix sp. AR4]